MDFIGLCPTTEAGNRWIIVGVDNCTKWPIAKSVKDATAESVAEFIYEEIEIFLQFGCPDEILLDRGASLKTIII